MSTSWVFDMFFLRRTASLGLIIAITLSGADLPVREVVLYKHGVGFFERQGTIPAGEEGRLDFRDSEMNDLLKSLTVSDASGSKVSGIRYDSNESLDEKLSRYPFAIADQEPLSAFLDRIKGSHVAMKTDRTLEGTIVGARSMSTGQDGDRHNVREQVTLLLDSGDLVNIDLSTISTMRFSDLRMQDQLKQYLQAVAQSRSKDKRSIYIDSASSGARQLDVAYISPTAIWKSSYRLTLADSQSMLEGWAIVDNTTGDDWSNVKLSVVSGRPISFISQLDTPRYGNRQVAELPEDAAAGPVVYGGAVSQNQAVANQFAASAAAAGGVIGGVIGDAAAALVPQAGLATQEQRAFKSKQAPPAKQWFSASAAVAGATGATLGELFEYNFAGPVTIKKNQSAMLPFLAEKLEARKLLIYQEDRGEHPVNAAELTNKTGKTLDGGPITVYDSGAYAGEALFETLRDGDRRLVGYAVDYGTRITSNFESGDKVVRELHAAYGLLSTKTASVQTRTYKIHNVDAKAKTLVVEQPISPEYRPISPTPMELTANAVRYQVKVPANGEASLEVKREYQMDESVGLAESTPDALLIVLQNKILSEKGRAQLQQLLETKQQIAQVSADLNHTGTEVHDLDGDQNRWRQNINSLRGIPGQEEQVRKYSMQIADSDSQLGKLRDRQKQLEQRKVSLDNNLRDQLAKLDF